MCAWCGIRALCSARYGDIAIDILTEFVSCVGEVLLVGTVLDIPGRVQVQE